jgi:aspartate racemase
MRTLGIIGGIAPGSTVDYYRLLITEYQARTTDAHYPSLIINSIDLTRLLRLAGEGRLDELADWLIEEVRRLAAAGATVGLMASNTPHLVFDAVSRASPIPLISIVEAAAEAAGARGFQSVGLIGTRFTMDGDFYRDVFARRGIEVRAPSPEDRSFVHDRYMRELVVGQFHPGTRAAVQAVIGRLAESGAEGVLLAGTELPLLLRDAGPSDVPLLDTTQIHVARAVTELLG